MIKNTTVQELDPGDDITIDGTRGHVTTVEDGGLRLIVATDTGVSTLDLLMSDYVTTENGDKVFPGWIDEGEAITEPVASTVVEVKRTMIQATIANGAGLTNYLFDGTEDITIHNYPDGVLIECDSCLAAEHHGSTAQRCKCCGLSGDQLGVVWTDHDEDCECGEELTD